VFTKVDSNFQFGKDFEEEVKLYLKTLGYPFAISKSSLYAVGSPHTWPSLLAALVWLIELVRNVCLGVRVL
jgi:kinetochore protein NDC80